MNDNFASFLVAPPRARLVVGLLKSNRGRECPAHACCGSSLGEGMLVRFRTVDFPGKGGVFEKAVEVWSDLQYHVWLGDRDSSSFPPPLLPPVLNRFCKVGWLGKGDSLREADAIDGRCGFVHAMLANHTETSMRRLDKRKNGAALVLMLPIGDEVALATALVDKKKGK